MRVFQSMVSAGMFALLLLAGCSGTGAQPAATSVTTPATTPTTPPSAANTTVYDEIQQVAGWLTCGACGNTGGGGSLASYQMSQGITSPSVSGDSAKFSISGSYAYANAYWFFRHPARSTAMSALTYEFDLYVPAGDENAPQAIEFECQQRLNSYVYNFAWQAEYTSNRWRVFNYTAKQWEDSGIALQRFAPGTWHHIIAEYHNDENSHTTYHDALTVDGTRYPVNILHSATPVSNTSNEFTNAFQLDLNGSATPYAVYVDRMKVTQVN